MTVGTVFERSKIALHKWLYATHLICASKKSISSKQLERMLGVTYKTAWFMSHRIREAMTDTAGGLLGGNGGGVVEVDETYWGNVGKQVKGARGDVTTNTVESSFAILKRGLYGTFHNVSEQHLQRYATEFDFRWNIVASSGLMTHNARLLC